MDTLKLLFATLRISSCENEVPVVEMSKENHITLELQKIIDLAPERAKGVLRDLKGETNLTAVMLKIFSKFNQEGLPVGIIAHCLHNWVHQTNHIIVSKLLENAPLSESTYWLEMIAQNDEIEEFKCVIEIFYYLVSPKLNDAASFLVKAAKKHCQHKDVVYMVVFLVCKLLDCDFVNQTANLAKSGIILSVSSLLKQLQSYNVLGMSIFDVCDVNDCMIYELPFYPLEAWYTRLARIFGREDVPKNAIRPIMGLLNCGFREILMQKDEDNDKYPDSFKSDGRIYLLLDLLTVAPLENITDLNQNSNFVLKLFALFDLPLNLNEKALVSLESYVSRLISRYLQKLKDFNSAYGNRTTIETIEIILYIIESGMFCPGHSLKVCREARGLKASYSCRVNLPSVEGCLLTLENILVQEKCSKEFVAKYCNSDMNVIESLVGFAKRYSDDAVTIELVGRILMHLLVQYPSPVPIDEIIPFLPLALSHLKTRSNIELYSMPTQNLSLITVFLLHYVAQGGTTAQVDIMNSQCSVGEEIMKILSNTHDKEIMDRAINCLFCVVRFHQFKVTPPDMLFGTLQKLWRSHEFDEDLRWNITIIMFKAATILIQKDNSLALLTKNFTDFKLVMATCVQNHWNAVPFFPDIICIIWISVRENHNGILRNLLLAKFSEKTMKGYLKYGDVKLAKIFRLISNVILDCLKNPLYNSPVIADEVDELQYLTEITGILNTIAKSSTLDEELYVLEDMVCPLMGLLERYDNEKIINNVKEFIRILHY